jgi:hypothetical protein
MFILLDLGFEISLKEWGVQFREDFGISFFLKINVCVKKDKSGQRDKLKILVKS